MSEISENECEKYKKWFEKICLDMCDEETFKDEYEMDTEDCTIKCQYFKLNDDVHVYEILRNNKNNGKQRSLLRPR